MVGRSGVTHSFDYHSINGPSTLNSSCVTTLEEANELEINLLQEDVERSGLADRQVDYYVGMDRGHEELQLP